MNEESSILKFPSGKYIIYDNNNINNEESEQREIENKRSKILFPTRGMVDNEESRVDTRSLKDGREREGEHQKLN